MKNIFFTLLILLSLTACNNDDNNNGSTNPVDQLPPATQTGENTFGCLLDGEVFIPRGGTNPLDCTYQFLNNEYYFGVQGNKRNTNNDLIRIGIVTEGIQLSENETYNLSSNDFGNASGVYFFNTSLNYTSQTYTGELTITKLDTDNQIVSGTFWFDVQDNDGVVHQIREGRFDMQYTQ
ncbi:MAG: hypothetical protein BM557_06695 [Flavobacterium sp. MedPE-SWcel]|uniref:hypothetical protein n=1 Tax=uncultured Flavobacterium sp. TaxID=165435 RepID=UPI000917BB88|nr:hypothetical protein [uncultured Flavobacterium sp.]OIQ18608.1 MAG: hypothetical protein BM557_06695 [Flavobacterium sp. MedPE-SWcel]